MHISIIIPTYNEAEGIGSLLSYLDQYSSGLIKEIIISDGGSTDATVNIAKSFHVQTVISPQKGRAAQMNYGASLASGQVFYFLHADTFPPKTFAQQIIAAYHKGFASGCFRLSFDHPSFFLKANCWFTRFNLTNVRFGDQSLFVSKEIFQKIGGFKNKMIVLEDQEIVTRIREHSKFIVLKDSVIASARKYIANGAVKTQAVYFLIYSMYKAGLSQQKLVTTYRKFIRQDKI
jgi:rSAM/selenodomain-associated transferase 2